MDTFEIVNFHYRITAGEQMTLVFTWTLQYNVVEASILALSTT
jgi:hypothetical protein